MNRWAVREIVVNAPRTIDTTPRLAVGGLFGSAFEVYKSSFGKFWLALLALFVPGVVLFLIAGLFDRGSFGIIFFAILGGVWLLLAYLFFHGVVVKIVEDVETVGSPSRSIGELVSSSAPQIPSLIVLVFASAAVIHVGYVLFIIPGIIVSLKLFVAVPALFIGQRKVFSTMAESAELTRDNLWRLVGIYLLIVLALLVVYLILVLLLDAAPVLGAILGLITAILVLPYLAIITAVIYFELRKVKAHRSATGQAGGPVGEAGI